MTIESVEHRSAPSVGLNPGSGNLRQNPIDPSLGLLAEYISQLWPTRDASKHKANQTQSAQQPSRPAASQPAAEPAPRAPSLLQASDNFPARETTEVGIRSNGNQQPQLGRDAPVRAVAEQARANAQRPADEELEARLNRALIEQAWLRGVDLT
jgi:hypothetical protein